MNKFRLTFVPPVFWMFSAALLFISKASSQSIPPFKMTLSDNKIFTAAELPKGKPLVLIYFDPDCEHCQKLMDELFKKINSFKKAEIVLVTFKPVNEVAEFEKKYGARNYANMKVGTEGEDFYLRYYYKLVHMPFTALYDSKGNYTYSYRDETPVDDLIRRLKNMK